MNRTATALPQVRTIGATVAAIALGVVALGWFNHRRQSARAQRPAPQIESATMPAGQKSSTISVRDAAHANATAPGGHQESAGAPKPNDRPVAISAGPAGNGAPPTRIPITLDPAASQKSAAAAGVSAAATRHRLKVNRPLDFARLEKAALDRYELGKAGDPGVDLAKLRTLADAGDAEAAFAFGLLLAYREGENADPNLAAEYFARAAAAGKARASAELGRLYLSGLGVPADAEQAAEFFTAAAAGGDPEGSFLMAMMHRLELFAGADPAAALPLLYAAAEHGHIAAVVTLSSLYRDKKLPDLDPARMQGWLQSAAETGDADALLHLAQFYIETGEAQKSFAVLETAAETGSYRAFFALIAMTNQPLTDPATRARIQGILDLHVADPATASAEAFFMLAFLQLFERDPNKGRDLVQSYLTEAGRRGFVQASLALDLLERGIPAGESLRQAGQLSAQDAYVRRLQLKQSPSTNGDHPPFLLAVQQPQYPTELSAERIPGKATVAFVIAADGSIQEVKVVDSTHPAFAAAAIAAVKQWRCQPASKDGRPVAARMQVPIHFNPAE